MDKKKVSREILRRADEILSTPEDFDRWIGIVSKEEPALYEWCGMHSGHILENIAREWGEMTFNQSKKIAHMLIIAILSGWIIQKLIEDRPYETDKNNSEGSEKNIPCRETEIFEKWIRGELTDSYYKYPLKGLGRNSTKYRAKKAFLIRKKAEREKNKKPGEGNSGV